MDKKSFSNFCNTYRYLVYATPYGPDLQAPEHGIIAGVKENDDTHYYELILRIAYPTVYVLLTTEETLKVYELENTGHYTGDDNFTEEALAYFLELFDTKYANSMYSLFEQYISKNGGDDIPEDVQEYIINRKASYDSRKRT